MIKKEIVEPPTYDQALELATERIAVGLEKV